MDKNYTGKELVGAEITALGYTFKIAKVIYAEHWDRFGYDIEFLDPRGGYHHWKQWDDGGEIKLPMPTYIEHGKFEGGVYYRNGEKRLVNCQGTDCTDLFRKYGYNV